MRRHDKMSMVITVYRYHLLFISRNNKYNMSVFDLTWASSMKTRIILVRIISIQMSSKCVDISVPVPKCLDTILPNVEQSHSYHLIFIVEQVYANLS